jgi:hypothetical protein
MIMMKLSFRHILFLLLALGVIVGCGNGAGATTPEAAVRRAGFGALEDVQIVGVRYVGERALVLYTGVDRTAGAGEHIYALGYTFAALTSTGWRAENSGAMGSTALPNPAEVLQYSVGSTQTPTEIRTLVVGRALDPRIASVEAVFDDGRAARDEVTNGVFAVVMIGADEACALRAFDAEGAEVQLPGHLAAPLSPHC